MAHEKLVFENAEGAENRTRKLNLMTAKHNETALQTLNNSGWTITATTTYQAIDGGGVIVIDEGRGKFEYTNATKTLKIYEDGIYTMDLMFSLAFPVSTELMLAIFVNGVNFQPYSPITAVGRGATKPATIVGTVTMMLNKNDTLQMMLKADSTQTVTCTGSNARIEKKVIG